MTYVQLTVRRHFATLVRPCTTTKSPKAVEIKKAIITAAGTEPADTAPANPGGPRRRHQDRAADSDRGDPRGRHRGDLRGRLSRATRPLMPLPPAGRVAGFGSSSRVRRSATAMRSLARVSSAGAEPFLLLVGDHLYVSGGSKRAAQQLVEIARRGELRRLRRAGHAREQAAVLRRGGRAAGRRAQGPL